MLFLLLFVAVNFNYAVQIEGTTLLYTPQKRFFVNDNLKWLLAKKTQATNTTTSILPSKFLF